MSNNFTNECKNNLQLNVKKNYNPSIEDQIEEQENNFINKINSAHAKETGKEKPVSSKSPLNPNGEIQTNFGCAREALPIDQLKDTMLASMIWQESICKAFNLTPQDVEDHIEEFCDYLVQCGEEYKSLQEAKKHFRNRLNLLINGNNKQAKGSGEDRRFEVARLIAKYTG